MKNLIIGFLAIIMMTGCSIVNPQERVVHTFMGKPVGESGSGPTLWVPFLYGNTKFDVSVQKHVVETTASSKDLQPLDSHIAVNWRIDSGDLTNFYKNIGDENDAVEKVISPAVNEVVKGATAKMTAEEIVSRRAELKKEIDEALQARLLRYGIHVDDVSIVDVKFSNEFIAAIEAKQVAEQKTKQAEYEAQRATVDAKASVNKAKGEAESNLAIARAEAEASLVKARAQSEGQKLLKQTLTQDVLQLEYLKKWNGQLPEVMSGSGGGMILNLPTRTTGATKTQEETDNN